MRVARRLPLSILIIGLGVTASCRSDSLISPSTVTQQPSNDGTAPTLKPSYVSCDVNMTSTRRHGNPNGVYTQTDGVQYLNVVVIQSKRGWLPADLF